MLITFLRHATAEDSALSKADSDRALTEKGAKQVKRLAIFCERNRLLPSKLYCSPVLRAQQTATLLHAHLPNCPAALSADWLNIGTEPQPLLAQLKQLADLGEDDVWLVGHEPGLSEAIAALLNMSATALCIKKASLTRLNADFSNPQSITLLWSLPCGLMR
ncbi:SixA phosphatase family protein [Methylomonas sp. HW2-6]|uniref:SixA phosphatase family protein n=1 Tax=Methylomonas sp. HW2-6 TaxID=3376687 RepID=UPI0040427B22